MLERRDEPRLRLKSLLTVAAIAKFLRKQLERDGAIEAGIAGAIHVPHASGPGDRDDHVWAKLDTRGQYHR